MSFKDKAMKAAESLQQQGKPVAQPQVAPDGPKSVQKPRTFRESRKSPGDNKPQPKFVIGPDKTLSLSFEIMNQGLAYKNAEEIIKAEQMKYLYPLIKPLCKLANAAVHQSVSSMKSPGFAKVRNADGMLTKEVELGSDGKPIRLPSALDVAKDAYNKMLSDPTTLKLLEQLESHLRTVFGDGDGDKDVDPKPMGQPYKAFKP